MYETVTPTTGHKQDELFPCQISWGQLKTTLAHREGQCAHHHVMASYRSVGGGEAPASEGGLGSGGSPATPTTTST